MRVVPVGQLADNYAYIIAGQGSRMAAVVDVAESAPVLEAAERLGLTIEAILSTHHHLDHVGGNQDLVGRLGAGSVRVYGFSGDSERIPCLTHPLDDGAGFVVAGLEGRAIFIPAHTRGHLAYYFERDATVFTGDTLFAGGCGRLFEGDAGQMMGSLARLASLPPHTRVYCGHEYTRKNLEFAAMLEPANPDLEARRREVEALRAKGEPTVPTTIEIEKKTNPFLRSESPELITNVTKRVPGTSSSPLAVFAATRKLKDSY